MVAVVTYWQIPDEETAFFDYLSRANDVVAFPGDSVADPALIRPTPLRSLLQRQDTSRISITLQEYATSPSLFEFQRKGLDTFPQYTLNSDFPCLVYSSGSIESGQLAQSNASACTSYLDKRENVVRSHPDQFVKWVSRVMAWLRRNTPEWHQYRGYRVTKRAAQEALSGLSLVPYHGWVGPCTGESSFMPGIRK